MNVPNYILPIFLLFLIHFYQGLSLNSIQSNNREPCLNKIEIASPSSNFDTIACERLLFAKLFYSNSNFREIVLYHNSYYKTIDENSEIIHSETVPRTFAFSDIRQLNNTYIAKARIHGTQNDIVFNVDFETLEIFLIRIDRRSTKVLAEEYTDFIEHHQDYLDSLSAELRVLLTSELLIPEGFQIFYTGKSQIIDQLNSAKFLIRTSIDTDTSGYCHREFAINNPSYTGSSDEIFVCHEQRNLIYKMEYREYELMKYELRFDSDEWTNYYEVVWYIGARNLGPELEFY